MARGLSLIKASQYWSTLSSDSDAKFDKTLEIDASKLNPMVTWGTSPEMVTDVDGFIPARTPKSKDAFLNSSFAVDNNTQNKSSLDIQQIQTRTYSATYDQVYKSVVSVLQDNRFKITHTDKDSGIVSADGTPEASENMSDAVAT